MDNQRLPLINLAYLYQGKSVEELCQSLLLTTMELENTRVKAEEELKMRDDQLVQLKDMLEKVLRERDEAQEKCQKLAFEKLILLQKQQMQLHSAPHSSGISSIEDEPRRGMDSNNGFSSSDTDESIVSSPILEQIVPAKVSLPTLEPESTLPVVLDRPLPEKGKLLQAVMRAGPLLQTLLLAGPLPQWRHPPPPIDSYQIPPPPVVIPSPPTPLEVSPPPPPHTSLHQDSLLSIISCNNSINNCGRVNRKRVISSEGPDYYTTETKYQRLVPQ